MSNETPNSLGCGPVRSADLQSSLQFPAAAYSLGTGLLLIVLVFTTSLSSPESFIGPKEAILQLTAGISIIAVLWSTASRIRLGLPEVCITGFGLMSLVSLFAGVPDVELGTRAMATTTASVLVFLSARTITRPRGSHLLAVFVVITALILALGVLLEVTGFLRISPPGYAPGGTLGNRNRAAHILVLAMPMLWNVMQRATRRGSLITISVVTACSTAAIVCTRSRVAWVAIIAFLCVLVVVTAIRSTAVFSRERSTLWMFAVIIGIAIGMSVINRGGWTDVERGQPVTATLSRLLEVKTGSGFGRKVQFERTLLIIRDDPLFGVGPGNWSRAYLNYAADDDPSVELMSPVPVPRLPQSDWIGLAAERGIVALLLLAAAAAALVREGVTALRVNPAETEHLRGLTLLFAIAIVGIMGLGDALLLTPTGALAVPLVLSIASAEETSKPMTVKFRPAARWVAICAVMLMTGLALHANRRLAAVATLLPDAHSAADNPDLLMQAVKTAPWHYESRFFLARYWATHGRCDLARAQIAAADRLFPHVPAVAELRQRCGVEKT